MKYKVYVVGGDLAYSNLLTLDYEISSLDKADIVLFTGGEDVFPELYNQPTGKFTYVNSSRDLKELDVFQMIKGSGKLLLGICRGAQFLTVASGGSLIQHVSGHAGPNHLINIIDENRDVEITSTHHQMMFPFVMDPSEYKIIAKSSERVSKTYLNGRDNEEHLPVNFVEPEIVFYNKTNCLCIQGHPEYMNKGSKAVAFINQLIIELLDGIQVKDIHEEVENEIPRVEFNDNGEFNQFVKNRYRGIEIQNFEPVAAPINLGAKINDVDNIFFDLVN